MGRWCCADIDSRADVCASIRSLLFWVCCKLWLHRCDANVLAWYLNAYCVDSTLSISTLHAALSTRHSNEERRLAATTSAALTHPLHRYECSMHGEWINKLLALAIILLRSRLQRHVKILYGKSANDAMTMTLSCGWQHPIIFASLVYRARIRCSCLVTMTVRRVRAFACM